MSKTDNKSIGYPKIVSTAPCNDDWFESKSHERISSKIADAIMDDGCRGIIGIDGGWGSGKSNLVGLAKNEIGKRTENDDKQKFVFITYDVWAHHTDFLRRSILEEFIDSLITEEVLDESWFEKIDMILARVREIDTKKVVKLNELVVATSFLAFAWPIINSLKEVFEYSYYVAIFVYVAVIIYVIRSRWISMKKYGQIIDLTTFFSEMFKLYVDKSNIETKPTYNETNNKVNEYKTVEFITEKEPTARQFRNWMKRIDDELKEKKTHVVLVIDNMDRLPIAKVKEIWSTIHAFFAECNYDYIQTVIPFDRNHIINAFKEENIQEVALPKKAETKTVAGAPKSYGNDFINKTFFVVFRVAPPILSDWRDYFERIWQEAFGPDIYGKHDTLLLIFEKLSLDFTPRKIIAFINECVTIYYVMGDKIPVEYLGLYVIGKETILKEPDKELLNPSFLGSLKTRYENDEELSKYLSAIHYQIDKDKALDVVYQPQVIKALDDGNINYITKMGNDRVLNALLPNAISELTNIDHGIEFLEEVGKREKKDVYHLDALWTQLFERLKPAQYTVLNYERHHAILLAHCPDKKAVVDYFLSVYLQMAKEWNVEDYIAGVKAFRKLAKHEVDAYFNAKEPAKAAVGIFENLLSAEQGDYKNYGLTCDINDFDQFVSEKDIEQFEHLDYLPILLKEGHKMKKTKDRLLALTGETVEPAHYKIIMSRLKELVDPNKERIEFEGYITDDTIRNLRNGVDVNSDFYYDLIAMRIARGKTYPNVPQYNSNFDTDLKNTDPAFVERVARALPYFTDFGLFLCTLKDFSVKDLVVEIAKLILREDSDIPAVFGAKSTVLASYADIITLTGIEPRALLLKLQKSDSPQNYQNMSKWPEQLFVDCKDIDLDIAKEINKEALALLDAVSTDTWKVQMTKPADEMKIWNVYKPQLINQKDAAIGMMKNYAKTGKDKPDGNTIINILPIYGDDHYEIKKSFKEIYDYVLAYWSLDKMVYFTKWFFEWGAIDNGEWLGQMYKTEYLDNDAVVKALLSVSDFLNSMELPEAFVEKMASMSIGNRKNDKELEAFCHSNAQIKAYIEKKQEGEIENQR